MVEVTTLQLRLEQCIGVSDGERRPGTDRSSDVRATGGDARTSGRHQHSHGVEQCHLETIEIGSAQVHLGIVGHVA